MWQIKGVPVIYPVIGVFILAGVVFFLINLKVDGSTQNQTSQDNQLSVLGTQTGAFNSQPTQVASAPPSLDQSVNPPIIPSPTPNPTPSPTAKASPSTTPTPSPTVTPQPTVTPTPTPTPTPSPSDSPSPTPTASP